MYQVQDEGTQGDDEGSFADDPEDGQRGGDVDDQQGAALGYIILPLQGKLFPVRRYNLNSERLICFELYG